MESGAPAHRTFKRSNRAGRQAGREKAEPSRTGLGDWAVARRAQGDFPGPKYGGARGHSLSGDRKGNTTFKVEYFPEGGGRQTGRRGKILKASHATLENWDFVQRAEETHCKFLRWKMVWR